MSRAIIIRRIQLKNILSHERTEIEFKPGLTAIVGPNGAGKSTIVDSIAYALLASGRTSLRGSSKKDMIRRGCVEGEIVVEFEVGGQRYLVRRVLSTVRSEDAQLFQIDEQGRQKLIVTGVSGVVDEVMKLLGIPNPEALRYTVISRQDELTKIIDLRPAERKEFILKLLGLEELEKAREALNPYVKKLREARGAYSQIEYQLRRYESELKRIEKEMNELRNRREQLLKEIEAVRREIEEKVQLKDLVKEYENYRDVVEKVEKLKDVDRQLKELSEVIKFAQSVKNLDIAEIRHRLAEINEVRSRINILKNQLEEIDNELNGLVSKLEFLKGREAIDVDELLDMVRKRIDVVRAEIAALEVEKNIVNESTKIIGTTSTCPVCRRPMDEELRQRVQKELELRRDEIEKKVKDLRSELRILEEVLVRVENLSKRRLEIVSRIDEYRKRFEELYRKVSEDKKFIQGVCTDLSKIEKLSDCFEGRSCIDALQCIRDKLNMFEGMYVQLLDLRKELFRSLENVDLENAVKKFEILRGSIRARGIDPDTISSDILEKMVEELKIKLQNLEKQLVGVDQRLKDLEEQKKRIVEEMDILRKEMEDLKKKIRVLNILEYLQERVLGKNGQLAQILTTLARHLIQKYANDVLRNLGLGLSIEITPDFDIVVKTPLGDLNIRSVSGGEKTAIATALRIALAYTVLGRIPGFFILDEPTAHLDVERRRMLFDMVKRLAEYMPQVIVVTHDEEVVSIADHVLEVFKSGTKSIVRYVRIQH